METHQEYQDISPEGAEYAEPEQPTGVVKTILKKIPTAISWGLSLAVYVGVPVFLEMRNMGFSQWAVHNGGIKKESLGLFGVRPY